MRVMKYAPWLALLVAAGGVALVTVYGPTEPAIAPPQTTNKSGDTKQQQPNAKEADGNAVAQNEKTKAKIYSPDCQKPEDHPQADLCAQWRMADAAEPQNLINAWGLGGLLATILATGLAAVAAWRTVWVMRDTAKRQLRAYVNLHNARSKDVIGDASFEINFKNSGQTPAYEVRTLAWVRMDEYPLKRPLVFGTFDHAPSVSTVGAQGISTVRLPAMKRLEPEMVDEFRRRMDEGSIAVYVFGIVTYKDIFEREWRTEFRVMCGGPTGIMDGQMANCEEGNRST